ncbi:MAG: methionine--tRNA ligase, partial [Candidatus Aenigmarchaeota archaeon]|nr:methionine--tRNA ligase [Candidatus Aenigmarchaeota archaeon]
MDGIYIKKILITSALPYANGHLHLGHIASTYLPADTFARYNRAIGNDVVFVCASDEHGTPIELNALKNKMNPEQFVKQWRKIHAASFKKAEIMFDKFHFTHSEENQKMADYFFLKAKKNGHIYEKEISAMYCPKDKRFLPDRFIKGTCPFCKSEDQYGDTCEKCGKIYNTTDLLDAKCSLCSTAPIQKKTKHFFFKLSSFSKKLESWINDNDSLQAEVKHYVLNWIKDGLKDWDVTRDGPYFGFEIPKTLNKYYYVWLDAPIGYVSSTVAWAEEKEKNWEDYWKNNENIYHFIGKDIVYFHYLFWPALLMSSGFSLPNSIPTRGYLTVDGVKMSKSRGTFILLDDFLNKFPADYMRYYFTATTANNTKDVDFSWKNFQTKINKELLNDFGNFIHRVLTFVNNNYRGLIPRVEIENEFSKKIEALPKDVGADFEKVELKRGLEKIMAFVHECNKYFNETEPWNKIKDDKQKADEIIYLSMKAISTLSIVMCPIIPAIAGKLQRMINIRVPKWGVIEPAKMINKPEVLINKITDDAIEEDPISKLNLRVAKILEVDDHPDADKLYVLKIDLGKEKRQVVAGLKNNYLKDELRGKKVCVLTNLKPAKLRGVESQGMILAADDKNNVSVLFAPKSKPGDSIIVDGLTSNPKNLVDFKDFEKLDFIVTSKKTIAYKGKVLKTEKEFLAVEKVA